IYNDGTGTPVVRNSIIWGNEGGDQIEYVSAAPDVQYSVVQGSYSGTGNLSIDPDFVRDPSPGDGNWATSWDNDNGDLHLLTTSNAIDAGDNTAVPPDTVDLDSDGNVTEPLPYDLDSTRRFTDMGAVADTGNGTAPIVDMGAYEYPRQCVYLPLIAKD
ncbi:MAG: hypothetical protein MUQ10_00815, partial [Anaerolineae bacterium]|nr:hypothetical protein [Anaerolineae bacterium]